MKVPTENYQVSRKAMGWIRRYRQLPHTDTGKETIKLLTSRRDIKIAAPPLRGDHSILVGEHG